MNSTPFEIVKYLFVLNRLGGSGNYIEIGFVLADRSKPFKGLPLLIYRRNGEMHPL